MKSIGKTKKRKKKAHKGKNHRLKAKPQRQKENIANPCYTVNRNEKGDLGFCHCFLAL